jgi:hypothetical protein
VTVIVSEAEQVLRGRQYRRAQVAAQLLTGLMFRDGVNKSREGQVRAAIEFADELLAQLDARNTAEIAQLHEAAKE